MPALPLTRLPRGRQAPHVACPAPRQATSALSHHRSQLPAVSAAEQGATAIHLHRRAAPSPTSPTPPPTAALPLEPFGSGEWRPKQSFRPGPLRHSALPCALRPVAGRARPFPDATRTPGSFAGALASIAPHLELRQPHLLLRRNYEPPRCSWRPDTVRRPSSVLALQGATSTHLNP